MKIGTKSVLFGAHCFFIHPFFVAYAWYKLWGFRDVPDKYLKSVSLKDWRLWVAFFIHDLGYFGKSNMDDFEGERHPIYGAEKMTLWFDNNSDHVTYSIENVYSFKDTIYRGYDYLYLGPWGRFTLLHSRFLAKRFKVPYSALCVADKLAGALEPKWLYLLKVTLSGEIKEYMQIANDPSGKYGSAQASTNKDIWYEKTAKLMREWAWKHRHLDDDEVTPTRYNYLNYLIKE